MKKIYLAARFSEQERMKQVRGYLMSLGHWVSSSWLDVPRQMNYIDWQDHAREHSVDCLQDIRNSDILIVDTLKGIGTRGGLFVEVGYALGLGKSVYVVGERPNLFFYHPFVKDYANWEDVYAFMDQC